LREADLNLLLLEEDRGPPGRSDFYWLQGTVEAGGYRGWSVFLAAPHHLREFAETLSGLAELAAREASVECGGEGNPEFSLQLASKDRRGHFHAAVRLTRPGRGMVEAKFDVDGTSLESFRRELAQVLRDGAGEACLAGWTAD
jgi:hypothetical protein